MRRVQVVGKRWAGNDMTLVTLRDWCDSLIALGTPESTPVVIFSEDDQTWKVAVDLVSHRAEKLDRHGNVNRPVSVEIIY